MQTSPPLLPPGTTTGSTTPINHNFNPFMMGGDVFGGSGSSSGSSSMRAFTMAQYKKAGEAIHLPFHFLLMIFVDRSVFSCFIAF